MAGLAIEPDRRGEEQKLGPQWNAADPHWQQAQSEMMNAAVKQLQRDFSSLEWLSEEWAQLNDHDFSERDIEDAIEVRGTVEGLAARLAAGQVPQLVGHDSTLPP